MQNSLIALGGALIGIILGLCLTRNAQYKQWLLDNRKEEYRESLTTLTEAQVTMSLFHPIENLPKEQMLELYNAWVAALITIRDRLYRGEQTNADRN